MWDGTLRMGFTTQDPTSFTSNELPDDSLEYFTQMPGSKVKEVENIKEWMIVAGKNGRRELQMMVDNIDFPNDIDNTKADEKFTNLSFHFTAHGNVYYSSYGGPQYLFLSGLPVHKDVWMVVDLYGNGDNFKILGECSGGVQPVAFLFSLATILHRHPHSSIAFIL